MCRIEASKRSSGKKPTAWEQEQKAERNCVLQYVTAGVSLAVGWDISVQAVKTQRARKELCLKAFMM